MNAETNNVESNVDGTTTENYSLIMVAKNYYNAAHFAECFERLDDFRESEQTCDIRLMASNKEMYAHKMVLASVSEYFKNAIYGLFLNDSGKNELELTEVKYEILSVLVNYMYSGKIEISSDNVYEIYNAADYYLMSPLKRICLEFLEENLDADNCVKVWIIASNCKNEKLITAATNFIFSSLEIASNTKEFLNLSNEEVNNIFKFWPKDELFDSVITSILRWAADKDNCEETVINLLKDIPHTGISDNYLENCLPTNEFIQNSSDCNKWIASIYKQKFLSLKLKYLEENEKSENEILESIKSESEQKFIRFLADQPIIFMDDYGNTTKFYKYNCHDGAFDLYNEIKDIYIYIGSNCIIYKNWIHVLGANRCYRFRYDDVHKNGHESAFQHNHGSFMCSTVLNDSIYIFGGAYSSIEGTRIDLNTKQATRYRLLYERSNSGVAVSDGVIYVCGGINTDVVERFDPREGRFTHFGNVGYTDNDYSSTSSGALSNKIYCTNGLEFKMADVRNGSIWTDIGSPDQGCTCLTTSYGQLYTIASEGLYKYNKEIHKWESISIFPELFSVRAAASFE